jgi:hypothetical protein
VVKEATNSQRKTGGAGPIGEQPITPGVVTTTGTTVVNEVKDKAAPEDDRWVAPRRDKRARGDARAQMRKLVQTCGLAQAMSTAVKVGGSDFAYSRLYSPGDEGRHIDWRATARTDKLHTKLFAEDPEPAVLMIIPSKYWGKGTLHERERRRHLEQTAALLGFSAEHHKTPFGVMVYSDRTELMAIGDGSSSSTDSLLDRLGALNSESKVEEKPSLVELELKQLKGRPALIFYCCDRPDDEIPPEILALGKKHEIVRLCVTPDRLSIAQPAMLRVHGTALGGNANAGITSRRKTTGYYDEMLAQRLLDRQPVEQDATTTLTLSVAEPFDRQLTDFFRRKR